MSEKESPKAKSTITDLATEKTVLGGDDMKKVSGGTATANNVSFGIQKPPSAVVEPAKPVDPGPDAALRAIQERRGYDLKQTK